MPRVKIDYIVSFSNEDPEHPASTLLAWDVSKKKWLCSKGEPSCSVVLQLSKAMKVSSVTIGAYQAALVEVLVGRSATPNDQFQVLVPSSVFQTPAEARRAATEGASRVRSFAGDALAAPARDQRWDRLRVVASQPYNKHCQFGLSFVHVFSEEVSPPAPPPLAPARLCSPPPSDEEGYRPGELFAQHLQRKDTTDTGAQIRQATSHALKNISDSSLKFSKIPLNKAPAPVRASPRDSYPPADRRRESLIYTPEDDTPNKKVDAVMQRHQRDIDKQKPKHGDHTLGKDQLTNKTLKDTKHTDTRTNTSGSDKTQNTSKDDDKDKDRRQKNSTTIKDNDRDKKQNVAGRANAGEGSSRNTGHGAGRDVGKGRKRTRSRSNSGSDNEAFDLVAGHVCPEPHRMLLDVRFVLSGYENPRRGALRTAAMALGARCERDWGPACTHLICAFPNTPKLRAVRSSANGSSAVVVLGEWIEECARTRRRLPWQWFATEPARRRYKPTGYDDAPADTHSECDTDDEIERVQQKMKKRRSSPPPTSSSPLAAPSSPLAPSPPRAASPVLDADVSANSDVMFVADQRIQGSVHVVESDSGGSTDEEAPPPPEPVGAEAGDGALPALLAGRRFAVRAGGEGGARLVRYLTAYGGLVLNDEEAEVDVVVCGGEPESAEAGAPGSARCVRAAWLWACHREQRVAPLDHYLLPSHATRTK